jgi:hypothetical protein
MRAAVGDRIVVVPRVVGGPARDARVVELRNADGSPPYVVEWSDTGQRTLYFPGSDGRLEHYEEATAPPSAGFHVKTWRITVHVFEHGDDTTAHAVLRADAPDPLEAKGSAHRHPADPEVPEIGDEVAVARALHRLADTLMGAATADTAAVRG